MFGEQTFAQLRTGFTRPCYLWKVSLARPMLFPVGSFSYTSCAVLCGEFLLHSLCCFMLRVCVTLLVLFYVGSVSYTLCAILCGEFVLYTWTILGGEFVLHTSAILSGEFLISPILFYVGSFSYMPMLFYVGIFSYTPYTVLCGEFLLHTTCCFIWGVFLSCPALFYVGSFSYTPMVFPLLHTRCWFMWGVCLTHPLLFYAWNLPTTPGLLVPTWQAWAYRRAAATHTGELASMGLLAGSGHRPTESGSKCNMLQKNSSAVQCYLAQFDHWWFGLESLLHTQASFYGEVSLTRPVQLFAEGFSYTCRASFT